MSLKIQLHCSDCEGSLQASVNEQQEEAQRDGSCWVARIERCSGGGGGVLLGQRLWRNRGHYYFFFSSQLDLTGPLVGAVNPEPLHLCRGQVRLASASVPRRRRHLFVAFFKPEFLGSAIQRLLWASSTLITQFNFLFFCRIPVKRQECPTLHMFSHEPWVLFWPLR